MAMANLDRQDLFLCPFDNVCDDYIFGELE